MGLFSHFYGREDVFQESGGFDRQRSISIPAKILKSQDVAVMVELQEADFNVLEFDI